MIKIVLPLIAAAGLLGAAPASVPAPRLLITATPNQFAPNPKACEAAIQEAREANGMPKLERRAASPDAPMFIAAVDHRIDNCRVLMMANDNRDIRPEPAPPKVAGMMPAR